MCVSKRRFIPSLAIANVTLRVKRQIKANLIKLYEAYTTLVALFNLFWGFFFPFVNLTLGFPGQAELVCSLKQDVLS